MNKDSRKVGTKLLEAMIIAHDSNDAIMHVAIYNSIYAVLETVWPSDAMYVLAEYGASEALDYINT